MLNARTLQSIQAHIGHQFSDLGLLKSALTHASASSGLSAYSQHMERLEFLGDAVLGLVISQSLFQQFPLLQEGELSRMRAALVRKESLLVVAKDWQLQGYLHVGEGERNAKGNIRSASIMANAVEAVLGAIFLDAGFEQVQRVIHTFWQSMLRDVNADQVKDAKSRLQEWTQAKGWGVPEYHLQDFGPQCEPRFIAQCHVQGKAYAEGRGGRKKQAELDAAEHTYAILVQGGKQI